VARWLQPRGLDVKHLALIALASVSAGGCFYTDPINQRPSLEILNTSGQTITRGQPNVTLQAIVDDPDDSFVALHWRLYACADATDFATCDPSPVREISSQTFVFDAPIKRANGQPATSLLVELEGTDDRGATARPSQQLVIPLGDGVPTLEIVHVSNYDTTVGTPIDIFSTFGDPDDKGPDGKLPLVTLSYEVFAPALSTAALGDLCAPDEPKCATSDDTLLREGKRITPDVTGEWMIEVTAVDPIGAMPGSTEGKTVVTHSIQVVSDQVPCMGVQTPLAPPAGSSIPLEDPTLFKIFSVSDALDPFPANTNDPLLAPAQFRWSIGVNGGALSVLDTEVGNSIAFDPASFVPGDLVEIRADIGDRANGFPQCATDTCGPPDCLQRQTWTVEVR
jgi:hypothetical protein